jgi:3-hydroxyacyl-CoA dehydrogenase/3a,7a,12a-trihydroxy-5b-cholest-24-enoyl-CoA hydratase
MAKRLLFDTRVAVVTGGGSGLGRACALALAQRGAKVLVNDLGTTYRGLPETTYVADCVVEEIKAAGGVAVANYDSVEYGDLIIRAALREFGRVDIIVNCAGVVRDKAFGKMSNTDWDLVMKVNLKGAFLVMNAAWPHMKKQQYGRIVNIGNIAGVTGGDRVSATAAAKMGLHGLTIALSSEGLKRNIRATTIAPLVSHNKLIPEELVPLVLYLSHEDCMVTGSLIQAGGGLIAMMRVERSRGAALGRKFGAEEVKKNWERIADFSVKTDAPADLPDALEKFKTLKPKL